MKSPRSLTLKIQRLPHAEGLALPAYQTPDAAGMDLVAAIAEADVLTLAPGRSAKVPTGLIFELPLGTEGQVRPRSGLAAKHSVTVLNTPGTIDADYRGEVAVILINLGSEPFHVRRGDRIAQLVVAPVLQVSVKEKRKLSSTARGPGGFGSTGVKAPVEPKARPNPKKSKAVPRSALVKKSRPAKGR